MNERLTPRALAQHLGGELKGVEELGLIRPAAFQEAAGDELTFYDGSDIVKLGLSKAGCIITSLRPETFNAKSLILVGNVRAAWARALGLFPSRAEERSPALCHVSSTALVHPSAVLLPFTYVGPEVEIGADALIGPNATVHRGSRIGSRVRIGAGSVIGSEGFGYATDDEGRHEHIPHLGRVVIADDVEIGAGVCIDRGTTGETLIGEGTKIDNLVHIAHNVRIGKRCLIAGQSGIAGSAVLEDDVKLAGQAGVKDHVRVGKGAVVLAKSAVFKDVRPGEVVSGIPARPHRLALRAQARLMKDARNAKDS